MILNRGKKYLPICVNSFKTKYFVPPTESFSLVTNLLSDGAQQSLLRIVDPWRHQFSHSRYLQWFVSHDFQCPFFIAGREGEFFLTVAAEATIQAGAGKSRKSFPSHPVLPKGRRAAHWGRHISWLIVRFLSNAFNFCCLQFRLSYYIWTTEAMASMLRILVTIPSSISPSQPVRHWPEIFLQLSRSHRQRQYAPSTEESVMWSVVLKLNSVTEGNSSTRWSADRKPSEPYHLYLGTMDNTFSPNFLGFCSALLTIVCVNNLIMAMQIDTDSLIKFTKTFHGEN